MNDPTLENSEIEVRDGSGIIDIMPMTERNKMRDDLKPPPEYYLQDEIRTPEGVVPIEKTVPEKNLAPKINPFHQIIYSIVSDLGFIDENTIYDSLVKEYRIFPDTDIAFDIVNKIIKTMHDRAIILEHVEKGVKHYVKGRPLTTEEVHLISFKRGYDPIAWQIMDFIEGYSKASRDMIDKFIILDLGWLTKMGSVDMYLNNLCIGEIWGQRVCSTKEGNIESIRENWYQFKNPLEPWSAKK